ncbi:MAG TPA: DUF882 domain-containing protein [Geminicoccaceae bacterium]|nr:DUF882 domain-containing protein [Geminicoccaceae bacterium]
MVRRRFLATAAGAAAGCLGSPLAAHARVARERSLSLHNIHTGETLKTVYWADGWYVDEALKEIDWHLRDHRTGQVKQIDLRLLNLLHDLRGVLDTGQSYSVVSGYRSPETNAMLARHSKAVARNSYHVRGMAVDIRVPGRSTEDVRWMAIGLRRGGVGHYPESDFVHVDVGPLRHW